MKYLFLSLLLLSVPAQANNTGTNQACLEIRNTIAAKLSANRMPPEKVMSHYARMCVSGYNDNAEQT